MVFLIAVCVADFAPLSSCENKTKYRYSSLLDDQDFVKAPKKEKVQFFVEVIIPKDHGDTSWTEPLKQTHAENLVHQLTEEPYTYSCDNQESFDYPNTIPIWLLFLFACGAFLYWLWGEKRQNVSL